MIRTGSEVLHRPTDRMGYVTRIYRPAGGVAFADIDCGQGNGFSAPLRELSAITVKRPTLGTAHIHSVPLRDLG